MATWTPIPNSSLEPGAPARSFDALALRDNPIALAEGASGAPRVVNAALGTVSSSSSNVMLRLVQSEKSISNQTPGNDDFSPDTLIPKRSDSLNRDWGFVCLLNGDVKIAFQHRVQTDLPPGLGQSRVRILRNGTQVFLAETGSVSFIDRSFDTSVAVGDVFVIQHALNRPTGGADLLSYIADLRILGTALHQAVA